MTKKKAILLEDSRDKASVIISQLHKAGFEVVHCMNFKNFQQNLQDVTAVDLFVTDNCVPFFAGDFPKPLAEQAALEFRREGFDAPIIQISGTPKQIDGDLISDMQSFRFSRVSDWQEAIADLPGKPGVNIGSTEQ